MTFNPLGTFDPNAAPIPKVLLQARSFQTLLPMAPKGSITRGYFHWTGGHYDTLFNDYHGMVEIEEAQWVFKLTHNPLDNLRGSANDPASHTYRRNTGAIGIAIAGMYKAETNDFGHEPITVSGLHALCAMMAAFCKQYSIDTQGKSVGGVYAGEPNILTHGEASWRVGNPAQYSDYFGERWDLATFVPSPVPVTREMTTVTGNALRTLTHTYKAAL